jgi:hypothetical protein
MKICKECKEVTCIGCYETKCNKLKRKYRYLKWNIKEYIRKLYKGKNNNYGINYEEDNENWKNYNVEWEWNENNEWEKNSRDDEDNKLKIKKSFNFKEEVINEVVICISEVPNWREHEKVEILIDIIRYSQRKINPLFQTRGGKLTRDHVNNVVKELIEGKIVYGKDLPIIEIVVKENRIYSMDNRRLYCLKEVFRNNKKICCKYRKDNRNFQRKRLQAEYERKSLGNDENFDYRNVIIDMYARGKEFIE